MKHCLSQGYIQKIEEQQTQASSDNKSLLDETQISKSPGISDTFSMGTTEAKEIINTRVVLLKPPPARPFKQRPPPPPAVQIVKDFSKQMASTAANTPLPIDQSPKIFTSQGGLSNNQNFKIIVKGKHGDR